MADTGHMNFFEVNECGLYKTSDKQSYGLLLEESFDYIKEWVKDRKMSITIPWDETSKTKPKCYCREIYKDPVTNDFLVILWKSESDSAGAIWGAEEDTENGSGEIFEYSNEVKGKKIIWGRPCYYWIIPETNTVVSIKFDHSLCDSQMFQDYVSECIKNRVKHPQKNTEIGDEGQMIMSFGVKDHPQRFRYRFDVSLKSLNTSSSELTKIINKITHFIWRETIPVKIEDKKAGWISTFKELPFVSAKPTSNKRNIEIRAEANPTLTELKTIIETYAKENRKPSDWENVGFLVDNNVTWVDKYRLKDHISIIPTSKILSAEFLLKEIHKNRVSFLSPIKKANASVDDSDKAEVPDPNKVYNIAEITA